MDDVAELLAGLLARTAGGAGPGPGDGLTLSCVPGAPPPTPPPGGPELGPPGGSPGELRWELLVTRGGAVVHRAVAASPAAVLRAGPTASGGSVASGAAGDAGPDTSSAPPSDLAAGLAALERVAASVPLVADLDAAWDLAPGAAGPAWRWTASVTRWDVLVEGSVLRWEADTPDAALTLALAELEDGAPGELGPRGGPESGPGSGPAGGAVSR